METEAHTDWVGGLVGKWAGWLNEHYLPPSCFGKIVLGRPRKYGTRTLYCTGSSYRLLSTIGKVFSIDSAAVGWSNRSVLDP